MIYSGNWQYLKQDVNGVYLNPEFLQVVSFVNWMLLSKTVSGLTSVSQFQPIWLPQEDPKGAPGEGVAPTSATGFTNPSLCLHTGASQDTNTLPADLPWWDASKQEIVFTHLNPMRLEELALESPWPSRNRLQKARTLAIGGSWTARNSGREDETQATHQPPLENQLWEATLGEPSIRNYTRTPHRPYREVFLLQTAFSHISIYFKTCFQRT